MLWQPWQTDHDLNELLTKFHNSSLGIFDPISLLRRAIAEDKVPGIKVTEIIPRLKDGGAFVKFTYPEGTSPKEIQGKNCTRTHSYSFSLTTRGFLTCKLLEYLS